MISRTPILSFVIFVSLVMKLLSQPQNAPVLPLDQLQPGMKGEVWTVFKGNTPEPFAVQVTGVLRNAAPCSVFSSRLRRCAT